ncbi:HNH endonuclease [Nocardia sp. GAS34]|uniref:HNH endonuclease n=1 Tax=Nocardia sp. GAS34 TaxID=3156305 RepID=UPI003D234ADE
MTHQPGLFTRKGPVVLRVGRHEHIGTMKISATDYQQKLQSAASYPVPFLRIGDRTYWLYGGKWFWDNDGLQANEVYALLEARDQRRRATVNRAQSLVAIQQNPAPYRRGAIPEDVRLLVWARDQASCRKCGSNVELQLDHIIPVSMGGASTPENLEVLCGPCNRRKGASLA